MTYSILHVGCGPRGSGLLPEFFAPDTWQELRLDIDPGVEPDFVASITEMACVADDSVEAVYSSHNLEHLYAHEVPLALAEFHRVLKPGGAVLVRVPDIQEAARHVAAGNLEGALYISPAGPISAIDVFWGLRTAVAAGNSFMAHKTGFTPDTLRGKLEQAGFEEVSTASGDLEIMAVAIKPGAKPLFDFKVAVLKTYRNRWHLVWSLISRR